MLCWFPLLASAPPPYPLLPHHSACLSHSPFSRKAETFLQLSGFFPWRISLIAPPDWVSLAGWWRWLYSISTPLPSWENVPFILPLYLLFLLQLFYIFSGIKKKASPKTKIFRCPRLQDSMILLCAKLSCSLYPRKFLEVPSGISGDTHMLLPDPHLSAVKQR